MTAPAPVPIIDFELDAPLARLHTLGLLLWPRETTSDERLNAAREWMWRCYESRMIEVAERAMLAVCDLGLGGTTRAIFKELSLGIDADEFMAPFGLMTDGDVELVFHLLLCARAKNHRLSRELEWWQERRHPSEAEKVDIRDYVIANELDSLLPRDAVLAGFALILVASMKVNHPKQTLTLTRARAVIAETVVLDGTKRSVRMQVEFWPHWGAVAPLWAGILAEAACWHRVNLINEARLEHEILNVLSIGKRRCLAYRYAKWFTTDEFARDHRAKRASGRMWDPKRAIHIPDCVQPLKPTLPPFVVLSNFTDL
jgi:hypothetical protein